MVCKLYINTLHYSSEYHISKCTLYITTLHYGSECRVPYFRVYTVYQYTTLQCRVQSTIRQSVHCTSLHYTTVQSAESYTVGVTSLATFSEANHMETATATVTSHTKYSYSTNCTRLTLEVCCAGQKVSKKD